MNDSHQSSAGPRVVLLTSPGLFGGEIINGLAQASGLNLVGVGLTGRLYRNKGPFATLRTLLKRTGWAYSRINLLTSAIAQTRMQLTGRPGGLKTSVAEVRTIQEINSEESAQWLSHLSPDYIVSFFFNQWIGKEVCEIPKLDCVNMHPSLLPDLRGPDPIFRTLERGISESGFTLHKVAAEFDAGQILHQEKFAVPPDSSWVSLYLHCVKRGSQLLGEWLAGEVDSEVLTNADDGGIYQTFPTAQEVAKFRKAGKKLGSIAEVHRAVSAMH